MESTSGRMALFVAMLGLFLAMAGARAEEARAPEIVAEKLERHVRVLASPEYGGRYGEAARKAEEYVQAQFVQAGLKVTVTEEKGYRGMPCRNVIGVAQAGDEPAPEHIIVSAHYDHIGMRRGKLHPGAGDNAAGVAVMIEIARHMKPVSGRDVLFISFDQEELGLVGSRLYVENPFRPLDECVAFTTMDILGRSLADIVTGELFCMGLERSDTLFEAVRAVEEPEGLRLAYVGEEVAQSRSDFAPFRDKGVPFVFFTGGIYSDYHQPTDTADRLDSEKFLREARVLLDATRAILAAPRAKYLEKPACRWEEAASLDRIVGRLLEKKDQIGLGNTEAMMAQGFRGTLQTIVRTKRMFPAQRNAIIGTCKLLTQALEGR